VSWFTLGDNTSNLFAVISCIIFASISKYNLLHTHQNQKKMGKHSTKSR
jgi:hypothetical protein